MKKIYTDMAPEPIGPYSQGIKQGELLFVSGQLGILPDGSLASGIEKQTERAIANIGKILEEAGTSFENVIKTTCFLKSLSDFAEFNRVYGECFTGKPARSCVEVSALPKDALVEIEVVAFCAQ